MKKVMNEIAMDSSRIIEVLVPDAKKEKKEKEKVVSHSKVVF